MNDNLQIHRLRQQLGDTICAAPSLHDLLDSYVEHLLNYFQASCGFYTPFWYEELSLVSSLKVYRDDDWSASEARVDHLCTRANQAYDADPQSHFLYANDGDPFVCIRLRDEGHPETWLIFGLKAPMEESTFHDVKTIVPWLQNGVIQCRQSMLVEAAQTRIDEMTRGMAETMAQLVQAEKMSELGKLTAGIAHEVNNPIGYIRSNLETLVDYVDTFESLFKEITAAGKINQEWADSIAEIKEKFELDFLIEDAHEIVATNFSGIDRIRDIVSDLHAFSRKGTGTLSPISITDVVQRCVKLTKTRFDNHHQVIANCHTDKPYCQGDASQLEQVVMNMMINAAHAMPTGGVLTIDISSTANRLLLKIKDTGLGMDKVTQQKIFLPFFTTKPTGEGTGLGLSISAGILQTHNATVTVDSEINQGTEFVISFPLYVETAN